MAPIPDGSPVLLYDGTCGLCAASVQFVLRHEQRTTLRFAPLQGTFARDLRARHGYLERVDSMIWVESPGSAGERVFVRADAVIQVCRYLGGAWTALQAARVLPRPVRDGLYNLIARHRHTLVRTSEQCFLPPATVRARFLS